MHVDFVKNQVERISHLPETTDPVQLQRLLKLNSSSDNRIAELHKGIEAAASREAALKTNLKATHDQLAAMAQELEGAKLTIRDQQRALTAAQVAHQEEIQALLRAKTQEIVVLRDSNDELLAQNEQLEHQVHVLRREQKKRTAIADCDGANVNPDDGSHLSSAFCCTSTELLSHRPDANTMSTMKAPVIPVIDDGYHAQSASMPTQMTMSGKLNQVSIAHVSVIPQPRRVHCIPNGDLFSKSFANHTGMVNPNGSAQMPGRGTLAEFRPGQQPYHVSTRRQLS